MELRHLRYFVAVAEDLSFTKAAARLHLAQPSLTRQVRNLEDEIGVRLLDRSRNRIALTEEGSRFLFDSKKLLATCAAMVSAVQRMQLGEHSELNIGYTAHLHYGLLPATFGAFRKLSPNVAINLFDLTRAEQFQALAAHRIDLGFIGLRPQIANAELHFAGISRDHILVALPAAHPLAQKAKLKLTDLSAQFFIGMSEKTHPGSRSWLVATCERAGFPATILQEADSETNAIKFVADGLGVALLPEQTTSLSHESVVFAPLFPPLRRESVISWRTDNLSKPLRDYIQIVKDLAGSK